MIEARSRLVGNLRNFVESELRGLVSWDDVTLMAGDPAPRIKHNRREPEGAFLPKAEVRFGEYVLIICSPNLLPPLGWVRLEADDALIDDGPIDQVTWQRLGKAIREREHGDEGRRAS